MTKTQKLEKCKKSQEKDRPGCEYPPFYRPTPFEPMPEYKRTPGLLTRGLNKRPLGDHTACWKIKPVCCPIKCPSSWVERMFQPFPRIGIGGVTEAISMGLQKVVLQTATHWKQHGFLFGGGARLVGGKQKTLTSLTDLTFHHTTTNTPHSHCNI